MIYNDINKTYKNHNFIIIGNGMGATMATYFCKKYYKRCTHCMLFEPATIYDILNVNKKYIKSNAKIKEIKNICDDMTMKNIIINTRKQFYIKHLIKYVNFFSKGANIPVIEFIVPVTAFYTEEPSDIPYINTSFDEIQAMYQHNLFYQASLLYSKKYAFDLTDLNQRIITHLQNIIHSNYIRYFD